ncbi:MAG TPA: polymer-forming cytoskeletal protein, partial [Thermoanaerobaculia bacterium]
MWTPCDHLDAFRRAGRTLRAASLLLALALPAAVPAFAQTTSHPPRRDSAPATGEHSALRRTIEQSYEVLPVGGGILLKLRAEKAGVKTIELAGDDIVVNGEKVGADVLRDWLKQDADAVLQLRAMAPSDRRALFGFKKDSTPASAAAPTPPAAPAAPTPPAPAAPEAEKSADEAPATTAEAADGDEADKGEKAEEPEKTAGSSKKVHTGSQVRFGGGVTVGPDELADEVMALGGSVHIDGEVRNDVVAMGGAVYVNGHVGGDVSSVGGSVHLGPHAEIGGDVSSVGGSVIREPGATVHGDVRGVGGAPGFRYDRRHRGDDWDPWPFWSLMPPIGGFLDLSWSTVKVVLLGLLVCLVMLLGRNAVDRVDYEISNRPSAFFVGFLSQLLFVPVLVVVTVLLAISIVGCVLFLLYPFIFLAIALGGLIGYTAVAYRIGSLIEQRFGRNFGSPYLTAIVGVGAIEIWALIGRLLNLAGG